ncbi:MAG: serine/threonine-protein kinase [Myxococcota bacterium]|jgi:serine/threonine-protein kinase
MSASVLAPGVVIADTYEVERQLGQGGMGEVWLAKHRRLAGKQVAIKVLRTPGELPAESLSRFRREAEIAARLEHPNIVQVLDFNTLASGEPYLVMEFLKGTSLAKRMAGGPLPLEQVMEVVRQVGAALQAAHAAGVVHRDLKPENIFLVPTALGDQVKVLDFGISKLADAQTFQTTDSVLIGTPLYMSPEQATGNNRDVSPQSDVFSLGSITYEMLAGRPPFLADNVAKVVFRIAYEKHRPLREARPDLPPAVAQAVERALTKDKAARTPDMATYVEELTGRALAPPRWEPDQVSGVYTPDVPVSASLAGGATVSHSSKERARPAPSPPTQSSPAPPAGSPPSRRPLALGVTAVLVAVAAVAAWRSAGPGPAPAPASGTVAGAVDAGAPAVPTVVAAAPDAGGADAGAEADAGEAVASAPDAGTPPTTPRAARTDPSGTPSEAEAKYLAELERMFAAHEYQRLIELRGAMRSHLRSPAARLQSSLLLTRAACALHEDRVLPLFVEQLRESASPATFARARRDCLERWPASELRWEQ